MPDQWTRRLLLCLVRRTAWLSPSQIPPTAPRRLPRRRACPPRPRPTRPWRVRAEPPGEDPRGRRPVGPLGAAPHPASGLLGRGPLTALATISAFRPLPAPPMGPDAEINGGAVRGRVVRAAPGV